MMMRKSRSRRRRRRRKRKRNKKKRKRRRMEEEEEEDQEQQESQEREKEEDVSNARACANTQLGRQRDGQTKNKSRPGRPERSDRQQEKERKTARCTNKQTDKESQSVLPTPPTTALPHQNQSSSPFGAQSPVANPIECYPFPPSPECHGCGQEIASRILCPTNHRIPIVI